MSKAERRKRARARAKERMGTQGQGEAQATSAANGFTGGRVEAIPPAGKVSADTVSQYITGPIEPVTPTLKQRAIGLDLPSGLRVPSVAEEEGEDEDEEETEDTTAEDDEDEDDSDADDDADDEDGDEDEDGEDEEDGDGEAEEEALFNVACTAVEQGDRLTWSEVVTNLCIAEIDDPRLGLLVALLVEGVEGEHRLTGDRLLKILTEIGLGDIVEEAREVAQLAPHEDGDSPEDRAVVRTNTRELKDQAAAALGPNAPAVGKKVGKGRPVRASDVRAHRSALSSPGLLGAVSGREGSPKP